MARPMLEVPQHSSPTSSSNNMTDRAILYQRYLEHYQRQLEDDDEDEEEEHVHALDLRICKVNESISRHNASDIWQQSQAASESSATNLVQHQPSGSRTSPQPLGIEPGSVGRNPSVLPPDSVNHVGATALPLLTERNMSPPRYRSPMPSAFPGQIPPDRRFTDHDKPEAETQRTAVSPMQNMWPPSSMVSPSSSAVNSCDTGQDLRDPQQRLHGGLPGSSPGPAGQPLLVRPLSELTSDRDIPPHTPSSLSNACRMVEAATATWRYSPYENSRSLLSGPPHILNVPHHSEKSFIKTERMSPKLRAASPRQHNHGLHGYETSAESFAHVRNSLVMRNRLTSAAIKSSFLHNVLKHKDKMATVKNEPLDTSIPSLNSVVSEATPASISSLENQHRSHPGPHQHSDSSSAELNRRMEFLDQSFRTHNSRYLMNIDYSPPPSPATSSQQHQVIHSHLMGNLMNPASDPHINVNPNSQSNSGSIRGMSSSVNSRIPEHPALRHNALLMRLHQGHLAAASSQHSAYRSQLKPDHYYNPRSLATSPSSPPPLEPLSPGSGDTSSQHSGGGYNGGGGFKTILGDHPPLSNSCQSSLQSAEHAKGKRGRPRKHAIKIPLPPLYVFIRNLLHNRHYNPRVITWVCETQGIFKVNNTAEFAKTWGLMKANRNEEMTYEKMSRAMRYHYGNEKQGRKGHLAMVKEKRLVYRFGEIAINWRSEEVMPVSLCQRHDICGSSMCLWRKE